MVATLSFARQHADLDGAAGLVYRVAFEQPLGIDKAFGLDTDVPGQLRRDRPRRTLLVYTDAIPECATAAEPATVTQRGEGVLPCRIRGRRRVVVNEEDVV